MKYILFSILNTFNQNIPAVTSEMIGGKHSSSVRSLLELTGCARKLKLKNYIETSDWEHFLFPVICELIGVLCLLVSFVDA